MSPLAAWENFYVIVGSAAGALTGLTFVVISLSAGRRMPGADWGVATFNTPTVVHFGIVLLVSAILSAPWPALSQAALMLGLCGLGGVAYGAIVVRRLFRRPDTYDPVLEDWLWNAVFPLAAYTALVVTAIILPGSPAPALFGTGAALVLLLFIGIHNAWDVVTWITVVRPLQQNQSAEDVGPGEDGEGEAGGVLDVPARAPAAVEGVVLPDGAEDASLAPEADESEQGNRSQE
jgi:hypothetical protein